MKIMKKMIPAIVVLFGIFVVLASNVSAGDTYPEKWKRSDCKNCPAGCGNGFCQSHCTSYAAWKLNELSVPFNNGYCGQHWGNAIDWKSVAEKANIPVDGTPFPGDVAWFSYGHVAFVEKVEFNSDGSVKNYTISEYNYKPCAYSAHTFLPNESGRPSAFIHIPMYDWGAMGYLDCLEMGGLCGDIFAGVSSTERAWLIKNLQAYGYLNNSTQQKVAWNARFGTGGGGQGGGTSPSPSSSLPELHIKGVNISDDRDGDHRKESYFPIEKFYILAEAASAGVEPGKDATLGCYLFQGDNREKVGEETIKHEHLKKGMTHTERFELKNIKPGVYQVKVRIDNEKKIKESNENNNWSTPVKLVIKAWPNFIINEIIVDGATSFITGTTLSVRGKFWNKGGDTKDGISVASYLVDSAGNSVLVATQTIKDYHLEENEYHWEGMTFTLPSTPGNYSLKLVADYNGLVKESNEGDNSMTIPIVVVAASTTTTTSTTTTSSTTSTTTTTSTSTSTTTTATFSSTTSTTTTKNLLSFPYFEDFENGAGGFFLKDRTSAKEAVLVVLEGEGVNGSDCLAVLNQNPPGDYWDVQTGIAGLDFKEGEYKLSFSLKSNTSGVFGIEFSDSVSPSQVFFYDETNLLLGWGDYSWSFWATDFSGVNPADIQLAFDFGGAAGSFYLDNVRLEILYESPDDKPVVSTAPASSASGESKKEGGGGCFIGTLFK